MNRVAPNMNGASDDAGQVHLAVLQRCGPCQPEYLGDIPDRCIPSVLGTAERAAFPPHRSAHPKYRQP
jgi:hypothetical protein